MAKTDAVRLQHMIDAGQKALTFTHGRSRRDLDCDEMLALAVVRLVEIVGEAAKNVSDSTKAQSPQIPWRQIAGTRDRLSHAYFDVNLDIIWNIITEEMPHLIPQLKTLLAEIETE